jgi:hypothetical protein
VFRKRLLAIGFVTLMILIRRSSGQSGAIDASTVPASAMQPGTDDQLMPLPDSLETDLPLQVVASPFHLGRLSLVSLSAYQGYDSNPDLLQPSLQATPVGTEFSALSALVVYSFRNAEWNVDLQYEPSVFVSPKLVAKNWTGNGTDAQLQHRLSSTWSLGVGDHFLYSPNVQSSIQGNQLALNMGGGISILTPFLSSSRSLLLNTVSGSLTHRISEQSTLVFHADQSFVRLSGSVTEEQSVPIPVEDSDSTDGGFTFNRVLGSRDSIEMNYDYRAQFSSTTQEGLASFHTASFGWSHEIAPTLRFSVSGGPGWSNPGISGALWRTTAQGSIAISRESRSGGVAVSFNRSDVFAGVIGNNFNNHYALRIDRKFGTHLRLTATGSYIQQQFFGGNDLTGEMGSFELAWFTTRNWAVFGQARYLDTHGTVVSIAPQKVVTAGVRWSWVPEKP